VVISEAPRADMGICSSRRLDGLFSEQKRLRKYQGKTELHEIRGTGAAAVAAPKDRFTSETDLK
jgi:hypothetical protein